MSRSRDLANLANNATGLETLTVSDITDLTATATELNYVDGVGSALQAQIDGKLASSGTFNGTIGSSATFPAHHIIKVQEKAITTKVRETTVNSWEDITGFTTDFVTTSASSKILIHGHMTVAGTNDCHVKMARVISGTETDIGIATEDASGTINGGRSLTGNMLTSADYPDHIGWVFIDEPGQASGTTITYKVKYYVGGSGQAFNMNRSNNHLYGTGSSGIVLMEIK
tara:strand:+ start:1188 stop:1871 length:684 start_codon:yes stop_codon:yes gene_type:complete